MPRFRPISCRKTPGVIEYELGCKLERERLELEEQIKSKYRDNTRTVIVKHETVSQQPDCTQDLVLKCQECGSNFVFSIGEQQFYKSKGFSLPKRCKICRGANKNKPVTNQNNPSSDSNNQSCNNAAEDIKMLVNRVLQMITSSNK